jgi:hypothetical protein
MRKLQRQIDLNEQRGNSAMVAQLLEQAAKEMGNAYSNKRTLEHSGPGGGPINTVNLTVYSDEQLDQLERILTSPAPAGGNDGDDPEGEAPPGA